MSGNGLSTLLDPTDRALLDSWLTRQDGESAAEFAQALAVPTDVAIRVPVDLVEEGR